MELRSSLKASERLVDAGEPPDGGRWVLAEKLPAPAVIFQSVRVRVTLRYDEEDWRGYFVIEERRTDALGKECWTAYDQHTYPWKALLSHIFERLAVDAGAAAAGIVEAINERK